MIQDEGNYISDHCQGEFAYRLANTLWYDECSGGRGYAHLGVSGTFADPDGLSPAEIGADNEARFRTRPEARTVTRWLDTLEIPEADHYELLGLATVFNVGAFQFCGEYQNLWLQRIDGFGNELHFHGGYMYVAYFLTGEYMPWDRKRGTLAARGANREIFSREPMRWRTRTWLGSLAGGSPMVVCRSNR